MTATTQMLLPVLWATAADCNNPATETALDAALAALRTGTSVAIVTAEMRIFRAMPAQTLAILGGVAAILWLLG